MPTLRSIRMVTWGNAWLAGTVSLDDLLDGVRGDDVAHTVALPAADPGVTAPATQNLPPPALLTPPADAAVRHDVALEALPVSLALAQLRDRGATRLHLALPAPGDPLGVAGPAATTEAVLAAGEGVLVAGAGVVLVPVAVGAGVQWSTLPAVAPAAITGRAEAERALGEGLIAAARELAELDVARANPELARALAAHAGGARGDELPPTLPERGVGLIARADRLRTALTVALADDGGARTSGEAAARRRVLRPLDNLVRRALVAACEHDLT